MLPTSEVIAEVARLIRELRLPAPVVDPVMQATSGDSLIDAAAVQVLVSDLFPLARLVTPNIPESERLTGMSIKTIDDMIAAADRIRSLAARAVLVKGGHLFGAGEKEAVDVLDDEGRVTVFREELIGGGEVHGSGCMLSAAIAAGLANGFDLESSIRAAKRFVTDLIRNSARLGHGARPLFVPGPSKQK
jgi:hydroxymethylpyrimidine kinase/phosphomethylpyrimidine kinase